MIIFNVIQSKNIDYNIKIIMTGVGRCGPEGKKDSKIDGCARYMIYSSHLKIYLPELHCGADLRRSRVHAPEQRGHLRQADQLSLSHID